MRNTARRLGAGAIAVTVTAALVGHVVLSQRVALAASAVTVNGASAYQRIDGFGISEAFGQANAIRNVSDIAVRKQMLDLLFSPSAGAGFSILRNLIPSDPSHTMAPNAPANPSATPTYVWDGNNDATDWGQLWLTKQAKSYGVTTIYNDAWSAPGFMKTNNDEANGGSLCGGPGASCASGDWRQAYANYLVQNVKNYASVGITVPYLGFANEPTFTTNYSSMLVNGAQAADFAKILAATVRSAGLSTKVTCCEALGWTGMPSYTSAVLGDSTAASAVDLFTSHGYSAGPNSVINTGGKPVWQTEWSNGAGAYNTAWDDNSAESGFRWAQNIHTGLTAANLNAFLYWWGISNSTSSNGALIQLKGTTLNPAKRFYSFANYSKFIRPGAVRIGATSADSNLQVSAFKNVDGSVAIVALNAATSAIDTSFTLPNTGIAAGSATPYLTNGSNNTAAQQPIAVVAGGFSATVPARSLVTYTIAGGGQPPSIRPTASISAGPSASPSIGPSASVRPSGSVRPTASVSPSPSLSHSPGSAGCAAAVSTNSWNGGFIATVTVTAGASPINGWRVTLALPGGAAVANAWNAVSSGASGTAHFANAGYNGHVAAGQSMQFGFQATGSAAGMTASCSVT